MADWEEVKRLAADFQRVQLSTTVQKLTERNCVELVQRLQSLGLLDVIYTIDGKEYLTPQELTKEIREELTVRGGRVNLVDLQQVLNVDLAHIEVKANEIVKLDPSLTLILGQLIDPSYLDWLAENVNDELQEQGQVTLADLTKNFDLPGHFLSQTINDRLGSIIKGQRDGDVLFTESYVSRHRAQIRGAFSALTRPVPLASVLNTLGLQDRLFYSIVDELLTTKRLAGSLSGGRQDKAIYVPDIYSKAQSEWVDNFYQQNGYLEYDTLTRLGISEPRGYIEKKMGLNRKSKNEQFLSTCYVGQAIRDQIEAEIEEALRTGGWIDTLPYLPSVCTLNDASQLLVSLMKSRTGAQVFCQSIVASDSYISSCRQPFEQLLKSKAEETARLNPGLLVPEKAGKVSEEIGVTRDDKKEQRRKKAAGATSGGKSGGGTQGREVKTKSTKKKGRGGGRGDDSDEETAPRGGGGAGGGSKSPELEFLSLEELGEKVKTEMKLDDGMEDFAAQIAAKLYRPLNKEFTELAKSVFLHTMGTDTGSARKKSHTEMAEKVNVLFSNIRLFEKGLKVFPEETQVVLSRHLLRTVCTDVINLLVNQVAVDMMLSASDSTQLSPEARQKLIAKVDDENLKSSLIKINSLLIGKSVDEWLDELDKTCSLMQLMLKKADKKKDRQVVFGHRQELAGQIQAETDLAMTLHLACVLLFHTYTQNIINCPGKSVPQIISFLKQYLPEEDHSLLIKGQEVVIHNMKQSAAAAEAGGENADSSLHPDTASLLSKIKELGLAKKRKAENGSNDS